MNTRRCALIFVLLLAAVVHAAEAKPAPKQTAKQNAAGAAKAAAAATSAAKAAKLDQYMAQWVAAGLFTGTVLVSDHDRVIFKKGYGLANREWNIPNAPDVKFRLGSLTKQ